MTPKQRSSKQQPGKPRGKQAITRKPAPMGAGLGMMLRRHSRWVLAIIVAAHVLLALLVLQPAPHTGGDNAAYLTLARSLLERQEYRNLYDPTEPPHTQYPPVFPAILAIALTLGITPWIKIKFLIIAFSATAVAFTYLWIRKRGRPEMAAGVAAIVALSPGVLEQSHWELSDVPFWAITMIAIWAWQFLPAGWRGRFAIAVVMTTVAYFTRSAGLPLLLAAGGWLVLRRRWSQLAVYAAVILPLAFLWWLRSENVQGGVNYVSQFWSLDPYDPAAGRIEFIDLFARMKENGWKYLSIHLPILLFGVPRMLQLGIPIIGLAVYGWAVRMRRPGIAELFIPLYIGLLLVWPAVWSGERFLLPALPFILFYAGDALVRLTRLLMRSAARVPAAICALLLMLFGMPATSAAISQGRACTALYRAGDRYACLPQQYKDFYGIAEIAQRVLPDKATVLSRKDRSFYVISGGVAGRQYPLSSDPAVFFKEAAMARARYVIFDRLDGLSNAYVAPVLLRKPDAFCILFNLGPDRAVVFGIHPAAATMPESITPGDGNFPTCGDEYWRSTAVKDSLVKGLIPLP